MRLRTDGKGGLNRRISNKELQNVERLEFDLEERLIDFAVGHSLFDMLRFISAGNGR